MPRPLFETLNTSANQYTGLIALWSALPAYTDRIKALVGSNDSLFAASTEDPALGDDDELSKVAVYDGNDYSVATTWAALDALNDASGDFSCAVWLNVTSMDSAWSGVVTKGRDDNSNQPYWGLWIDSSNNWNYLTCAVNNSVVEQLTFAASTGLHHVVFGRSAGTKNLWVDGSPVNSSSGNTVNAANNRNVYFGFGPYSGSIEYSNVNIGHVAIYNRVPNDEEVALWFGINSRWDLYRRQWVFGA